MITRYRASLDRVNLDALAPEIMILDIAHGTPVFTNQASALAGRSGQIVTGRTVPSCSVTITIEIHTQDTQRRQAVCTLVQRWAMGGGKLRVNSRPHHFLQVICDRPPTVPSELRWTGKITIGLTANEIPYWQEDTERTARATTEKGASLYVAGTVEDTPVGAEISNNSGQTVNTLTITAGDTVFSFTDLALASGETLRIGQDERGLLYIRAGGASKMDKRTPESSDELRIRQNEHVSVSVTADATVTAVFKARGREL